jgi:hypothetical protein
MPLKTMLRIRFHKVADGYLFGAPSKKTRIMRSRRRRHNAFHAKQSARIYALQRWGTRFGYHLGWVAERVQAVKESRNEKTQHHGRV